MDCRLPDSSLHGISQARILELLVPSPGDLSDPRTKPASPASPALAGGFFTTVPTGKPYKVILKNANSPKGNGSTVTSARVPVL